MINVKNGDITFYHPDFVIHKNIDRTSMENIISNMIIRQSQTDTGYYYDYCWCDLEKDHKIYTSFCFYHNRLYEINLYPQHHFVDHSMSPSCSDCNVDWELVKKWYNKYFHADYLQFNWGEIRFIRGNDPIYAPTRIRIRYSREIPVEPDFVV